MLLIAAIAVAGAQVSAAERNVLFEKFSASWCPHCSSASQDIGQLLATDGDKFIAFDAFAATDGRYTTPWGVSRAFEF